MLIFLLLYLSSLSFLSPHAFSFSPFSLLFCVTSSNFPENTNCEHRLHFSLTFLLVWLSSPKWICFPFSFLSRFVELILITLVVLSSYFNLSVPLIWSPFSGKIYFHDFFLALWKSIWTHLSPGVNIIILMYAFPFIFYPSSFSLSYFYEMSVSVLRSYADTILILLNMELGCLFSYMLQKTVRDAGGVRAGISGINRVVGMATHSSILAWEIPWTEELDGL